MVLRRLLARLCGPTLLSATETAAVRDDFRKLEHDWTSRIARIPVQRRQAVGSVAPSALNRYACLLLFISVDQVYCITYHGLLGASVGEVWPEFYAETIEHSRSLLLKVAQLASNPEFRPFHWRWPGNHQPLHALAILLVDLIETPGKPSAEQSRRAIDVIFALCYSDGGVAGSGMERPLNAAGRAAWAYLRRLRIRAWQRAGLDPAVVWTREQAVRYCNEQSEPAFGMLAGDPGPMWSQAESPGALEAFAGSSRQSVTSAHESMATSQGVFSPTNIDWGYIGEVLEGQPMDFGFSDDP